MSRKETRRWASTRKSETSFWPIARARVPRQANAGVPTVSGYRLLVVCGYGAEFKRWLTLDDADEDLLKSALLAFEN